MYQRVLLNVFQFLLAKAVLFLAVASINFPALDNCWTVDSTPTQRCICHSVNVTACCNGSALPLHSISG
jgi:hypothetical protein